MTEWPEAVMGEWAVIWRGEPGDREEGMEQKEEKRRVARWSMNYKPDSKTAEAPCRTKKNKKQQQNEIIRDSFLT